MPYKEQTQLSITREAGDGVRRLARTLGVSLDDAVRALLDEGRSRLIRRRRKALEKEERRAS